MSEQRNELTEVEPDLSTALLAEILCVRYGPWVLVAINDGERDEQGAVTVSLLAGNGPDGSEDIRDFLIAAVLGMPGGPDRMRELLAQEEARVPVNEATGRQSDVCMIPDCGCSGEAHP